MASCPCFRICCAAIVALLSTETAGVPRVQAATLIVTATADSGPGSLRDTIAAATNGDVIQFDPALNGQTIVLTSATLFVGSGITIEGPGSSLLTVQRASGAPSFPIFGVSQNGNGFSISGLTIANGAGGIAIVSNGGTNVMIANCNITGNTGHGVYCTRGIGQNRMTIINSTISNNTGDQGGGIYIQGGCPCMESNSCGVTIINTTVYGNSATQGGGIFAEGILTVMNSTVSSNSADQGGGIRHSNWLTLFGQNEFTLVNSTITDNLATEGGGVYSDDTSSVGHTRNSIVALNVAPSGPDIHGAMISEGFNLVGNNSGADISPVQVSDQIGTPATPIDPLLGPLQDNVGSPGTELEFAL